MGFAIAVEQTVTCILIGQNLTVTMASMGDSINCTDSKNRSAL